MMEGSGAGSVLVTHGSGCGSGRAKNIRIRIRNTVVKVWWMQRQWRRTLWWRCWWWCRWWLRWHRQFLWWLWWEGCVRGTGHRIVRLWRFRQSQRGKKWQIFLFSLIRLNFNDQSALGIKKHGRYSQVLGKINTYYTIKEENCYVIIVGNYGTVPRRLTCREDIS